MSLLICILYNKKVQKAEALRPSLKRTKLLPDLRITFYIYLSIYLYMYRYPPSSNRIIGEYIVTKMLAILQLLLRFLTNSKAIHILCHMDCHVGIHVLVAYVVSTVLIVTSICKFDKYQSTF
jgi:hypothetical protein